MANLRLHPATLYKGWEFVSLNNHCNLKIVTENLMNCKK